MTAPASTPFLPGVENVIEDMFFKAYRLAPFSYFIFSPEFTILEANLRAAELLGYNTEFFKGTPFEQFVAAESHDCLRQHAELLRQSPSLRRAVTLKLRRRKDDKSGDEFSARMESFSLEGAVFSCVTDVSETVQVEYAARAAEAANKAKSSFLAMMSHEIRTPLCSILGYDTMLLESDLSWSERRNCAEKIRTNGEHLLRIIEDILDLSKVEAGKFECQRTRAALNLELQPVIEELERRASIRGLGFKFEIENAMPEYIETDPSRLKQILYNVVGNAIKFTRQGRITIVARTNCESETLEFEVADTGVGMTEEQSKILFRIFSRGHNSNAFPGTGLGLFLSKALARELGGDIELVHSAPGIGTKFKISIATGALDGATWIESFSKPALTQGRDCESEPPLLEGVRALVVEDCVDVRYLICHFLKHARAIVDIANNGAEAVEKVSLYDYDVIYMDMQMPVMDGYVATELLRQRGCRKPIIALTANAMKEEREHCLQVGCSDFISKPVDFRKLVQKTSHHLHH